MIRASVVVGMVGVIAASWWVASLAPARVQTGCPATAGGDGFSLLAVGDTGRPSHFPISFDKQRVVGSALAEEDRRAPVDALILLGDNFYHEGLRASDAETRIRDNLVSPYCSFVALEGPLSDRLAKSCTHSDSPRIQLLAVLGNHDYGAPESPGLERDLIPQYISNWRVPTDLAEVVEFRSGVSLILLDSERLVRGADPAAVTRALRASRGPWRIVISHRPILLPSGGASDGIARAIAAAGVPVHVLLSGHEHNLQAWTDDGQTGLHVIAGSGSAIRPVRHGGQAFALASLGFARVDQVTLPEGDRLDVSLFAVPRWPWDHAGDEPAARFHVDAAAHVEADATCRGAAGPDDVLQTVRNANGSGGPGGRSL